MGSPRTGPADSVDQAASAPPERASARILVAAEKRVRCYWISIRSSASGFATVSSSKETLCFSPLSTSDASDSTSISNSGVSGGLTVVLFSPTTSVPGRRDPPSAPPRLRWVRCLSIVRFVHVARRVLAMGIHVRASADYSRFLLLCVDNRGPRVRPRTRGGTRRSRSGGGAVWIRVRPWDQCDSTCVCHGRVVTSSV